MVKAPKPRAGNSEAQARRFKEAARELGCDESEEAFDDKLRVIAKQKTPAPKRSAAAKNEGRKG